MAFIQRAPWPIGSRAQLRINGKRGARSPSEIRDSPEFKDLDSDTVAFRLSFHRDLKSLFSKFQNTAEDHHLLLAQAIAHVATMVCSRICGDGKRALTDSVIKALAPALQYPKAW